MRITAENLTVWRGRREVVRGVSLTVDPGEAVAIVGPNGGGKTTLLQALLGLLPHASGCARLDGDDVTRLPRREIARRAAFLPQQVEGFAGFCVADVVRAARYAHRRPFEPLCATDEDAVRSAMDACAITDLSDRPMHALSGGERQKVWLAAAVAQDAPALLLDEPTTALDPRHQADLIRMLRRLRDEGKTILIVTHDLDAAVALDCRVVALRDGRKVFDAPVSSFLDEGALRDVFDCGFELLSSSDGTPSVRVRV